MASAVQVHATTFSVQNLAPNTVGGRRYEAEMGEAWTIKMLQDVRAFIVEALSLSYGPCGHVKLIIEEFEDFDGAAYSSGDVIHVGAAHVEGMGEDLRFEIKGLMLHEMTHSFQNNRGEYGTDAHFTGVIEGIANHIEFTAGHGVNRPKEKGGDWFAGYDATAHFFAWIDETQCKGFVNRLNQRMGLLEWDDVFFKDITGKDVDTLWTMY